MGKRAPPTASSNPKPPLGGKGKTFVKPAPSAPKVNPFDQFRTKAKHTVANARPRSANIAKSRSQAIEKRMSTIGMEMSQRNRASSLIDKRFGEHDTGVSEEDKMLIRFQKTRQKQLVNARKGAFNLNSDDENEEEYFLTHAGKKLDEINYGSGPRGPQFHPDAPRGPQFNQVDHTNDVEQGYESHSDDSFDEARKEIGLSDFGGMKLKSRAMDEIDDAGDPLVPIIKTKAESMADLIKKSKMHKYQAQKDREERNETTELLNQDFEELKSLLGLDNQTLKAYKRSTIKNKESDDEDMGEVESGEEMEEDDFDYGSDSEPENDRAGHHDRNNRINGNTHDGNNGSSADPDAMELDEFDLMVKRLSKPGIRRAIPADALLTEEHIAKAGNARLMQLEKNRLARMNSQLTNNVDDDEKVSSTPFVPVPHRADDLDDAFTSQWLPQEDSSDPEEESDEEDEISGDENENEHSDDEQGPSASKKRKLHEEAEDQHVNNGHVAKPVQESIMELKKVEILPETGELPYALTMPEDYPKFSQLLSNQSAERQAIIIQRLRACHHLALAPENRTKLFNLLKFLLKRIIEIGSQWSKELKLDQLDDITDEKVMYLVQSVEILQKPIFDLSVQLPDYSSQICREMIEQLHQTHLKRLNAMVNTQTSVVPAFPNILFAQILSAVFSVSDRRHTVISPCIIQLTHVLSNVRIQTASDALRTLLMVNVFASFIKDAKRYAGEPFSILFFILNSFIKQNKSSDITEENTDAKIVKKSKSENSTSTPSHSTQKNTSFILTDTINPNLYISPTVLKIEDAEAMNLEIPEKTVLQHLGSGSLRPVTTSSTKTKKTKDAKGVKGATNEVHADVIKFEVLQTCLQLLMQYLSMYSMETYASDLIIHTRTLLKQLEDDKLPKRVFKVKESLLHLTAKWEKSLSLIRLPLQQFLKAADVLPVLTPDFDDHYFGEKMTVDKVAKETKKLKRKIKSEQKGAEKELRKDTRFIHQQKMLKHAETRSEFLAKNNANLAMLEGQQSEMNKERLKFKRKK